MLGNRKRKQRAESADSELAAFKDDLLSLDEYAEDGYSEDEYTDEEYVEEEYCEDDYSDDSYSEYDDDRDYFDADEDYDSEYNTASFDTASLEVLSHVDYDTASIDYEAVRQTVEEQEYFDDEPGQYTEEIGYDTASLDHTGESDDENYDESPYDDYKDSYEEVVDKSQDSEYDDAYDESEQSDKLEEDEYIDLDKSYDREYDGLHKKSNVLKIVLIAAACVLLAAVGIYALRDRLINRRPASPGIEYITTPNGVTIPYSEQMAGSGSQLSGIEIIGGAGLSTALDARKNSVADAQEQPSESHDYDEAEIITRTSVSIELITVKSDLKIRFINNETGKLIPNVAFKVTVTDPSGKSLSWTDDDRDGIIYKSSISEGKYTVHVEEIEGDSYQGYTWPADKSVTVKSTIEYSRVDVQGEVKEAAQVNENAEDTASRGNTDQQNMTDTTENIASSESADYSEISKDTITNPVPADVSGNDTAVDMGAQLKDNSGNEVYVYENDAYRKAVNADYEKFDKFYIISGTKYTGWQTIDGSTYYYDKDGKPVTGTQVIGGVTYQFGVDGKLTSASGVLGIDVSKWNSAIDWNAVKAAGVEFVIIRVGYRGSSAGALIDDAMFTTNIQGAKAAGLKVGVYFVTQAVNDVEAVYEASMVLDRIKGYSLDYPVFLDVEPSGGRGDTIDKATRTAVITAFCETIRSAGYTAGVYANKTWLTSKMDASALGNYVIWVAHYSSVCGYTGRYTVWQYTDKGTLPGINGSVDLNLWYS